MNELLKARVAKLEQVLIGIQSDAQDPVVQNRLDGAITFIKDIAVEVGKTQELLENLLTELKKSNIISDERVERLKMLSALDFEVQHLKSRLADIISRENELMSLGPIPQALKDSTEKAKKDLWAQIEELEQQLKLVEHERNNPKG